jgi:hypothetical protein
MVVMNAQDSLPDKQLSHGVIDVTLAMGSCSARPQFQTNTWIFLMPLKPLT